MEDLSQHDQEVEEDDEAPEQEQPQKVERPVR